MGRGMNQVIEDLLYVFGCFPLASLFHLRDNRHRLIRGMYQEDGNGCLFYLLSEPLPPEERIDSRPALTRYFTGRSGYPACEEPGYQPARRLVRLIDGESCPRYEGVSHLSWAMVQECLERAIAARQAGEEQAWWVERRALAQLREMAMGDVRVSTAPCRLPPAAGY